MLKTTAIETDEHRGTLVGSSTPGPPTRTHFAAHRIEFERKRKMHYNEVKALALAKKSIDEELSALDKDEKTPVTADKSPAKPSGAYRTLDDKRRRHVTALLRRPRTSSWRCLPGDNS